MSESQENVEIMSVVPIKQNTCVHNYPSISFEVGLRVRTCELIQCVRAGWGLFRKRKWMKVSCFPLDGASEAKF